MPKGDCLLPRSAFPLHSMVSDPTVRPMWQEKKNMNKCSFHPLNEAAEKVQELCAVQHLLGAVGDLPVRHDVSTQLWPLLSLGLSPAPQQHNTQTVCWVTLLPQAVGPQRGRGNINLYPETSTWIPSPQVSVSLQSSNWLASFSQNFVLSVPQARTSRGHIPWEQAGLSECPLPWLGVRRSYLYLKNGTAQHSDNSTKGILSLSKLIFL